MSHGDSMRDPQLDLGGELRFNDESGRGLPSSTIRPYDCFTPRRGKYTVSPLRLPVTEEHPTVPIDVNGINKLAAEYYHLLYDRTYGMRSMVLR